jgi:hypothetical protein
VSWPRSLSLVVARDSCRWVPVVVMSLATHGIASLLAEAAALLRGRDRISEAAWR